MAVVRQEAGGEPARFIIFRGAKLYLTGRAEEPFVALRPVVAGMGLDWRTQQKKLLRRLDEWEVLSLSLSVEGQLGVWLCMPLRRLNDFFASLLPHRVSARRKEEVAHYRKGCVAALWQGWKEHGQHNQPGLAADRAAPSGQSPEAAGTEVNEYPQDAPPVCEAEEQDISALYAEAWEVSQSALLSLRDSGRRARQALGGGKATRNVACGLDSLLGRQACAIYAMAERAYDTHVAILEQLDIMRQTARCIKSARDKPLVAKSPVMFP